MQLQGDATLEPLVLWSDAQGRGQEQEEAGKVRIYKLQLEFAGSEFEVHSRCSCASLVCMAGATIACKNLRTRMQNGAHVQICMHRIRKSIFHVRNIAPGYLSHMHGHLTPHDQEIITSTAGSEDTNAKEQFRMCML